MGHFFQHESAKGPCKLTVNLYLQCSTGKAYINLSHDISNVRAAKAIKKLENETEWCMLMCLSVLNKLV